MELRKIIEGLDANATSMADIVTGGNYGKDTVYVMDLLVDSVHAIDDEYPNKDLIFKAVKVIQRIEPTLDDKDLNLLFVVAMNRIMRLISEVAKEQQVSRLNLN